MGRLPSSRGRGLLSNDRWQELQVGGQVHAQGPRVREEHHEGPHNWRHEEEVDELVASLAVVGPIEGQLQATQLVSTAPVRQEPRQGASHQAWACETWSSVSKFSPFHSFIFTVAAAGARRERCRHCVCLGKRGALV